MSTSDARIQLLTLNSAAIHKKFGTLYLRDEIRDVSKSAAIHKNLVPCIYEMKLGMYQKVAQYIKNLDHSIYVVMLDEIVGGG